MNTPAKVLNWLPFWPMADPPCGTEKNQLDYHRRIVQWFAHYLKGEPAPKWITEGVPASASGGR